MVGLRLIQWLVGCNVILRSENAVEGVGSLLVHTSTQDWASDSDSRSERQNGDQSNFLDFVENELVNAELNLEIAPNTEPSHQNRLVRPGG